jgi:hypothetical protein
MPPVTVALGPSVGIPVSPVSRCTGPLSKPRRTVIKHVAHRRRTPFLSSHSLHHRPREHTTSLSLVLMSVSGDWSAAAAVGVQPPLPPLLLFGELTPLATIVLIVDFL